MTESISSGLLVQGMRPEAARRQVEIFRQRFKEPHFYFAQHAAFPLALTPDLLYRLWANFQRNIHGEKLKIPWLAVADLLLSPLCEEVDVGYELYEMDVTIRALLLDDLQVNLRFGKRRIDELSSFLQDYAQQQLKSSDPILLDTARGQRWTALAYARPEEVIREMAEALTILHKNNGMEQMRIVSLMETLGALAEPLAVLEGFAPLLTYAQEITKFVKEDKEIAQAQKSFAKETELVERVLGIRLPTLEQLQQASDARRDFFISYHHTDQDWSQWIGWQLEEAGYDIVLQEWSFRPGSDFKQEIDTILQIAKHIIVVLSPDFLNQFMAMTNWSLTLIQDARTKDERRTLIAVQVRECVEELKSLLGDFVYTDFVHVSEQEAREMLLHDVDIVDMDRDVLVSTPSIIQKSRVAAEKPLFPVQRGKVSELSPTPFVFFSYSQTDSEFAARLVADLRTYGVTIWVDTSMIKIGYDNREKTIRDAISTAQAVLFIASPASRSSKTVRAELDLAQFYKRPIYPLWIAGESWMDVVPFGMGNMSYIDARDAHYQAALSKIVVAFEKIGIPVIYPSSETESEFSAKHTQDLPRVIGSKTVWFIRHAECETNVELPTADATTAQLTPKGIKQAEQIASAIPRCPDLIITSSYLRAKQTADYTRKRFPDAPLEEWPVHEFTYLSQSISGRSTTVDERRTLVDEYWSRLDLHYTDGNGGESFTNLMNRVQEILERLKNIDEDFIVIFSHGQFILAVLSWLLGVNFSNMEQFRHFLLTNKYPNGAIVKVVLEQQNAWVSQFFMSHLDM